MPLLGACLCDPLESLLLRALPALEGVRLVHRQPVLAAQLPFPVAAS